MNPILFEVCCGSAEDALAAYRGGADRVELNSDLFHGGLTPTLGALRTVKKHAPNFPVMCMVRPREGGFCYTDTEFEVMLEDARVFVENGADGIVFGFLHEDGTLDIERCRAMMEVIGERESVFHRAIDVMPDWQFRKGAMLYATPTREAYCRQVTNSYDWQVVGIIGEKWFHVWNPWTGEAGFARVEDEMPGNG